MSGWIGAWGTTATVTNLTVTGSQVISVNTSTDAFRITQTGAGKAMVVEDSANPDSTPFVIDAIGLVGVGRTSPSVAVDIYSSIPQVKLEGTGTTSIVRVNASFGNADLGAIGTQSSSPFMLFTGNTERMRIDSSGNVLVTGSGGIGYGTGSGGTVTQTISRTTGVTINKTNGVITLVLAAGLMTYQTFTVTNSTVSATDVIYVSQKSGTDKYIILVTAVAAGSFAITFATTGGTTIEQPVFNFAVFKAVTA